MKKNILLLIALIAIIFISGAGAGFFAGRLTAPQPQRKRHKLPRTKTEMKTMFQRHICQRLKLTDEQKKSAQVIIEGWFDEMGKLRELHAPLYDAVFNKFYTQMVPILSPEQKMELDKLKTRFTKQFNGKQGECPPPPPPPPEKDKQ